MAALAKAPRMAAQGTVVLADDLALVRQATAQVLTAEGYRVLEAADGDEALALAEANRGELVAVVTDVSMPGRDGHALLAELRARGFEVPVVVMSGSENVEGFDGVVTKPFAEAELLDALARAITAAR